jgi:abhydrolase domain-containing protein 17
MDMISSFIKKQIEYFTFFHAPKKRGYDASNQRLFFIGENEETKIACMEYGRPEIGPVILYSHGNATDIGYVDGYLAKLSRDMDINIISYDYPGYGLSPGIPSESEVLRAIQSVMNYLISVGEYKSSDIILYGASIGTGPSVYIASLDDQIKGVLLQTPYTSICGCASKYLEYACEYMPTDPNIFKTSKIIHKIKSPITMIHGTDDQIIAISHATELFKIIQNTNDKNKFLVIRGAKHNIDQFPYHGHIMESLRGLLE